jgi:Zn-dependent M28 family amino/carboxypeptidase
MGCSGKGKAVVMPGDSFEGRLPPLTQTQRQYARELRGHVEELAVRIGERNLRRRPKALSDAADYLAGQLGGPLRRLPYSVRKQAVENLELTLAGTSRREEIVVIGAHYDSASGSPGANDNATGVAAALVLARSLRAAPRARTVRVVLFANEEPPYFQTERMGSLVYARACRKDEDRIVAMLSLETMGYYSNAPDSQHYPPLVGAFYPDRGNFIGFVGNPDSRPLLRDVVTRFRKHAAFPSEGAALSPGLPGIGWSDHWSFWQVDYPAIMVTDTAPFRDPRYHTSGDTAARLDYASLARVVVGLEAVVRELANP